MNYETHIGVYGVISRERESVLIKKSRGAYIGSWDLPGGKIEFGERPVETLMREVLEETGLKVTSVELLLADSFVTVYMKENEETKLHHLGIVYRCEIEYFKDLRKEGDALDAAEARWVLWDEIDELRLSPFANKVLPRMSEPVGGAGGFPLRGKP
jgi:8-oxo-dGTP pyrophosphatase MutT (NUDIX family)